jgi:hypothetical protein
MHSSDKGGVKSFLAKAKTFIERKDYTSFLSACLPQGRVFAYLNTLNDIGKSTIPVYSSIIY